jgi:predicted acylesterase/phospholipase RssA
MNIKHLVLPGGGSNFFTFYGIIRESHKEKIWNYDTLSSIHCTSCSSILAFVMLLKLDWSIIDNYIINRPWETVYTITPEMCLGMVHSKGLIDIEYLYIFAEPLLKTVEWSNKITLKEVYDLTKIDVYIYVTNYNTMMPYCFHYATDPDIPLLLAIYMSSSIPLLAQPLAWKDTHYIDGGLYNNNPIKSCTDITNIDEILSFNISYSSGSNTIKFDDLNMFNYIQDLLSKFINKFKEHNNPHIITPYQITVLLPQIWEQSWGVLVSSSEARQQLINNGLPYIKDFIKQHE